MINVNEYFDGQVKSLGYTTSEGKSTVGVMAPGSYEFGTSMYEIVTIVEGELKVQLPGKNDWETFSVGEKFEVPANASFKVEVNAPTAYLCLYR